MQLDARDAALAERTGVEVFDEIKARSESTGRASTRYEGAGIEACTAPATATLTLQTYIAETGCLGPSRERRANRV